METQDYPIRHFARMVEFATELKSISAQVLAHEYSYESFGSWCVILRCKGVPFRVVCDGKEDEVIVQRSASGKPPYAWETAVGQRAFACGVDLAVGELVEAIRTNATAG